MPQSRRYFSTTHRDLALVGPGVKIPAVLGVRIDNPDAERTHGIALKQLGQLRHEGGELEVLWRVVLSLVTEPGQFVLRHGEFLRIHPAGRPPPLTVCRTCKGRGSILGPAAEGEEGPDPALDEVDLFDFLAARRGKQPCPICGGSGRVREG